MAVAHYLEALELQKEIVKVHTVFGGKNPHPNCLVGGVPCSINIEATVAGGAIDMERLNLVSKVIDDTHRLHRQRLHPRPAGDRRVLQALGRPSAAACRARTWLAYGEFPDSRQRRPATRAC